MEYFSMSYLSSFNMFPYLAIPLEALCLREFKMSLHATPSSEEHELIGHHIVINVTRCIRHKPSINPPTTLAFLDIAQEFL